MDAKRNIASVFVKAPQINLAKSIKNIDRIYRINRIEVKIYPVNPVILSNLFSSPQTYIIINLRSSAVPISLCVELAKDLNCSIIFLWILSTVLHPMDNFLHFQKSYQ